MYLNFPGKAPKGEQFCFRVYQQEPRDHQRSSAQLNNINEHLKNGKKEVERLERERELRQEDVEKEVKSQGGVRSYRSYRMDEGCLPWMLALVAWVVLVESVDEVAGEETAGGSDKRRERERCRAWWMLWSCLVVFRCRSIQSKWCSSISVCSPDFLSFAQWHPNTRLTVFSNMKYQHDWMIDNKQGQLNLGSTVSPVAWRKRRHVPSSHFYNMSIRADVHVRRWQDRVGLYWWLQN